MKLFRVFAKIGICMAIGTTMPLAASVASVKVSGMGGAGTANPVDALAASYNPAAAADLDNRFDIGAFWLQDGGSIKTFDRLDPTHDIHVNAFHRSRDMFTPDLGLHYNINCDWSAGIVAYGNNYSKVTYKDHLFCFGSTPAGFEFINMTVAPYLAYKIGQNNFGVSLNYNIQRLKANGIQIQAMYPIFIPVLGPGQPGGLIGSYHPNQVTNNGYSYSQGVGVSLGWLCHLSDCLNFGVKWQSETSMQRFNKYRGLLAGEGKVNVPSKVTVGIMWRALPCLKLAFDFEVEQWRAIRALHNPLLHNGFERPNGTRHGPGFGWRNKFIYHFGGEYYWNDCLTFRMGYRYSPVCYSGKNILINLLVMDCIEHYLAAGATWNITPCSELSFVVAQGFNNRVTGIGTDTTAIYPVGKGSASQKAHRFVAGLSFGQSY